MIGQAERLIQLKKLQKEPVNNKPSRIVTFASGKGGTGKTFLALNTAFFLSKIGKKILFIDFDINLANASIILNQYPKISLYNFFIGQNLLRNTIVPLNEKLHIIYGDSSKMDFPELDKRSITEFLRQLHEIEERYDFIILDTGSGSSKEHIDLLLNAYLNILVVTPEPSSVMDAYILSKLLKHNNFANKKGLVINRCQNNEEAELTYTNLSLALDHFLRDRIDLLGYFNADHLVLESLKNQEIFIENNQENPVAVQIKNLSNKLIKIHQVANNNH